MVLSAEPQLRSKQNGYWQNVSALKIYEKKNAKNKSTTRMKKKLIEVYFFKKSPELLKTLEIRPAPFFKLVNYLGFLHSNS